MVKIFPFKGISYNKKKIKKIDRVIAPPYDVISPEDQDALYNQHEYNVIKLIFGKIFPDDTAFNSRYTRAAHYFEGLLKHNILAQEEKPCVYIYEQVFRIKGKKYVRLGFMALLRLEDPGKAKVFPHEETFPNPKTDRLEMLRKCSANFESVFSMFHDEKFKITKLLKKFTRNKPFLEAKDKDGTIHKIWKLDKKSPIHGLMREMRDKWVFIADGHHRFEASLKYREEMKNKTQKFLEEDPYNHILMYFTPIESKGLVVLPINRLVKPLQMNFDPTLFCQELTEHFLVQEFPFTKKTFKKVKNKFCKIFADAQKAGSCTDEEKRRPHIFGMYLTGQENKLYLLTLKDESLVDDFLADNKPKAWKYLDVNILHTLIIERLLGIKKGSPEAEHNIKYIKGTEQGFEEVQKGTCPIAFFLNPCKADDITFLAGKYEKMPQKSTYFYPKLASGLVMYKIVPEDKIEY